MLVLIAITALLCSLEIQANLMINAFYPPNVVEESCSGAVSWTKWFNQVDPNTNNGLDQEALPIVQMFNPGQVCAQHLALQIQSVSVPPDTVSVQLGWLVMNNNVVGIQSQTPGIDLQIRFCCPSAELATTTAPPTGPTVPTTPRPKTNGTCGRAEIKNSFSRIFGGAHAIPNSWPWQVLYEERKSCGVNQVCLGLCGGTLIDDRHVLTATHCIGTTNPASITITAGLHYKYGNEAETRQVRTVEKIFNHPEYNTQSHANDITVLRLSQPVEFNKYVQPACLPGPDPQPEENVILIGWGALELGGGAYHTLKEAQLQVVGQCRRFWAQVNDEKQICVANYKTGDSACQGDSGGPMLYESDGQWIVSGVTSFGSGNGCMTNANSPPNVYTRVSAYLPWIESIIN